MGACSSRYALDTASGSHVCGHRDTGTLQEVTVRAIGRHHARAVVRSLRAPERANPAAREVFTWDPWALRIQENLLRGSAHELEDNVAT